MNKFNKKIRLLKLEIFEWYQKIDSFMTKQRSQSEMKIIFEKQYIEISLVHWQTKKVFYNANHIQDIEEFNRVRIIFEEIIGYKESE